MEARAYRSASASSFSCTGGRAVGSLRKNGSNSVWQVHIACETGLRPGSPDKGAAPCAPILANPKSRRGLESAAGPCQVPRRAAASSPLQDRVKRRASVVRRGNRLHPFGPTEGDHGWSAGARPPIVLRGEATDIVGQDAHNPWREIYPVRPGITPPPSLRADLRSLQRRARCGAGPFAPGSRVLLRSRTRAAP